jgi:hypothetical protein
MRDQTARNRGRMTTSTDQGASKKPRSKDAKSSKRKVSAIQIQIYKCTTWVPFLSISKQIGDAPSATLGRQALLLRHIRQGIRGVWQSRDASSGALGRQALLVPRMRQGLRDS